MAAANRSQSFQLASVLLQCGAEFTRESCDILTLPADAFFLRLSEQSPVCVCVGVCGCVLTSVLIWPEKTDDCF